MGTADRAATMNQILISDRVTEAARARGVLFYKTGVLLHAQTTQGGAAPAGSWLLRRMVCAMQLY